MGIALARRGGVKHRKNSPQVTVFSQSGEVAMLRAGRWHDCRSESTGKTDERSYNDENSVIEQPLTTACGGGPKGEALIGCDVISSVSQ